MGRFVISVRIRTACVAAAVFAMPAAADSTSYDITALLYRPHPFAASSIGAGSRGTPVPEMHIRIPARVPVPGIHATPVRRAASPAVSEIRPPAASGSERSAGNGESRVRRVLSELRTGVLIHDEGPFTRREEESVAVNLELLLVAPEFLRGVWSPRPHLGATVSTAGDTSEVYLGLSWEWDIWGAWFAGFGLGGAVHNGRLRTESLDRKELGCRFLFRESVEAGYRFAGRHSVSIFFDHISNAGLCDRNEGQENAGLRYGYRF